MNEIEKLRKEARAVIAGYNAGDDFDAVVNRLASIGYALEDALTRAQQDGFVVADHRVRTLSYAERFIARKSAHFGRQKNSS